MKKVSFLSLAIVLIAALLSACQTPAGRSAGEVVDDATITSEVKAKLLEDSVTKGIAITVQTFEGTVTLIGAVDNRDQVHRATQIARSVKGVKKVDNRLQLKTK